MSPGAVKTSAVGIAKRPGKSWSLPVRAWAALPSV